MVFMLKFNFIILKMTSRDLKGIKFEEGPRCYKYTAILPDGKRVNFGHRSYEHFKDSVPKSRGGGIWSHKDHGDHERRKNYRKRHTRMNKDGKLTKDIKFSPEWFSYYFLW